MKIKNLTTVDGVNTVDFGSAASRFYWFKNIGTTTVYVSGDPDITAGGDGVAELAAGGSVCIETLGGKVYILGAGKVQIHNTGDKFCPFKSAPVSSGGGVQAEGNPVQMDNLQGGVPFSEITVKGKNLYDNSIIVGMVVTQTGDIVGGSNYLSTQNYINVEGNKTYVLSNAESKEFDTVVFYDSDKSFISSLPLNRTEPFISSFTTPANCKYVRWRYYFDNTASVDMLTNIQLTYRDLTVNVNGTETTITLDSNPYTIPNDIRQVDGLNNISVSAGELSVMGVRKNKAIKRIWDKLDELTTAIIVSNGESE